MKWQMQFLNERIFNRKPTVLSGVAMVACYYWLKITREIRYRHSHWSIFVANLKHARLKNSIDESEWEKVRLMCEIMEEFALIRFHSHCPQKIFDYTHILWCFGCIMTVLVNRQMP